MTRYLLCSLAGCVAIAIAACTTGPIPSALVITTDADQYTLPTHGSVVVHAIATNRGTHTLYILPFEWHVQTRDPNGVWAAPDTSQLIGGSLAVVAVPAGTSIADSAALGTTGTYRMVLAYGSDSSHATARQAASNHFVVTQ